MRAFLLVLLVVCSTCEEPQKAEQRVKVQTASALLAEGRAEVAKGRPEKAIPLFKQAISQQPDDISLYLNLAEAYRAAGNETGAALTLKQAEQVGGSDPSLKRARADLFLKMHQVNSAITELIALRDLELLTDAEVLDLTRLLAHAGRIDEAFKTLEKIQLRSPDDPEAKVVEAEVLLARGDELLAAKLMDRLLQENPTLASAHVLRARYFFANAQPELALQDLDMLAGDDAKTVPVVALRARVLNELGRNEDAATLLQKVISERPKDPELLALQAETKLLQGESGEALLLVDQVLADQPKWARALYVRGRAMEEQQNQAQAALDYEAALKTDPNFAPALSRLWRIYDARKQKADAMNALERLFFLNEISAEEKVALAQHYADTWANVDRGMKLIDEALRRDPKNAEYLKIKKQLKGGSSGKKKGPGVIIMKHR
ncbi:MAG: tetratricopeptide repeat protein [Myxococcota bacterium]